MYLQGRELRSTIKGIRNPGQHAMRVFLSTSGTKDFSARRIRTVASGCLDTRKYSKRRFSQSFSASITPCWRSEIDSTSLWSRCSSIYGLRKYFSKLLHRNLALLCSYHWQAWHSPPRLKSNCNFQRLFTPKKIVLQVC